MPTIEFAESEWGPSDSVDHPEGGALLDICDEAHAPVAFSCRSANCGICRVEIVTGIDLLEPAESEERELLSALTASSSERLACRAVVRTGAGLVSVRWVTRTS